MEICIDFDGTCVTHEYPLVGRSIGAEPVLRELAEKGHQLILYTMRSDRKVKSLWGNSEELYLTDAVNWFKENDIPLYGIQENPTQKEWTDSPKAYAQLYIDDAALGCPLIFPNNGDELERPYADWVRIRQMLERMGIL
jgi:hypothetical protein